MELERLGGWAVPGGFFLLRFDSEPAVRVLRLLLLLFSIVLTVAFALVIVSFCEFLFIFPSLDLGMTPVDCWLRCNGCELRLPSEVVAILQH